MADKNEEAVVEKEGKEKKEKKSLPLMSIVLVALLVVSLAVSVFSLLTVMKVSGALSEMSSGEKEPEDPSMIPLSEIENIKFKDDFIVIYEDSEDKSTYSIVVKIGIGVRNNKETAEDYTMITETFAQKEDIIRNGVQELLMKKSHEDFQDPEKKEALEEDLVNHFRERLGSDAVIEVFLNDILISHKK